MLFVCPSKVTQNFSGNVLFWPQLPHLGRYAGRGISQDCHRDYKKRAHLTATIAWLIQSSFKRPSAPPWGSTTGTIYIFPWSSPSSRLRLVCIIVVYGMGDRLLAANRLCVSNDGVLFSQQKCFCKLTAKRRRNFLTVSAARPYSNFSVEWWISLVD